MGEEQAGEFSQDENKHIESFWVIQRSHVLYLIWALNTSCTNQWSHQGMIKEIKET